MGDALAFEMLLFIVFFLILEVRRGLRRTLVWYRQSQQSDDQLRAALWQILRNK
jgi:hypothetical protein